MAKATIPGIAMKANSARQNMDLTRKADRPRADRAKGRCGAIRVERAVALHRLAGGSGYRVIVSKQAHNLLSDLVTIETIGRTLVW